MDNWAEDGSLRKTVRDEGKAYSASGSGRIPWISKTDIAACAFSALTAETPPNGDYVILGPELLSYEEVSRVCTLWLPEQAGALGAANLTNRISVCGHTQRSGRQENCPC